ncbi:hypothetical protein [Streptomyces antimycoticus]|uniref:hypothetical protein n=1 Tax=Streptomyces antimycoticus TaxID=68175 RepID=UPI0033CC0C23
MHFRYDPDEWRPELPGPVRSVATDDLTADTLVVWERRPYRVVEVREREQANWPKEYREAWVKQNMPDPATWYCRPRAIVLRSEEEPTAKPQHLQGPNNYYWHTLPEHYPLCRLCKEIPPCRHVHNERIMARATEKMEKEMALMPGVCHGCREPITKRQKHFTFPGPNLIRPDLGDNTAVFHTRKGCWDFLSSYDKRWAAAEEGRSRFFYCEGTETEHHDGSFECSKPDCAAKRVHKDLVQHAMWVRHHPRMREARGCWCLASQLF